jgi:hypothetical protein
MAFEPIQRGALMTLPLVVSMLMWADGTEEGVQLGLAASAIMPEKVQ